MRFRELWLRAFAAAAVALASNPDIHEPAPENSAEGILFGNSNATWYGTPKIVAWKPMAVLYDNFLTEAECDYILSLARPTLEPAMMVNSRIEKHIKSKSRTSRGAFFDSFQTDVLTMITQRIAHVAKVPPENLEPWQVMAYGKSEQYTRHVDFYDRDSRFFGNDVDRFGGQRIKTALLYLTNAVGGETVFPKATRNNTIGERSCAGKGSGVVAKRGRMLIFDDVLPNGDVDHLASHQSCPVTAGEKVVVSRFIRQEACYLNRFFSKRKWNGNVFCEDDHGRCQEWAAMGYCTSPNRVIQERMVGDEAWPGFCEKTCEACRPLEDTVIDLRNELGQEIPPEAYP